MKSLYYDLAPSDPVENLQWRIRCRERALTDVVVSIETVGFTDGVHLFSDTEAAERWMLEQIRQHGGACSHYSVEEFRKRLAPYEDFWLMELHDRRQ